MSLKLDNRTEAESAHTVPLGTRKRDTPEQSADAFIDSMLAKAAAAYNPITEVVRMTPEIAKALLARNEGNRNITQRRVKDYAGDMIAGRWKGLNGTTIVVSRCGYINDGQHRLLALIDADARIPMLSVWGVERESRTTLDQNKARTSGDYLTMSGLSHGTGIAAAASILYGYRNKIMGDGKFRDAISSGKRPTKAALHEFTIENIEQITRAFKLCDVKPARILGKASRLAAAFCILEDAAGFADASDFMGRIIEGENMRKNEPAYVVRQKLLSERTIGAASTPQRILEIIVRGWNAERRGDAMSHMPIKYNIPKVLR